MNYFAKQVQAFYKQVIVFIIFFIVLFTAIGLMTTSKPTSRLSSAIFSNWMNHMDGSVFTYLFSIEQPGILLASNVEQPDSSIMGAWLQMVTSVQMKDAKSLLSQEIPGFSTYENRIIVAGEGMNEIDPLAHESGPPLEIIFREREAVDDTKEAKEEPTDEQKPEQTTDGKEVVFLYHSHNRESFLPHLPEETDADNAYHEEVNIKKISDRIHKKLKESGIGSQVDDTDIMQVLKDKDWKYGKSYEASRPVVETALQDNQDIQYIFDVHRDSLPRDKTIKEVEGKTYATILFVIGAEHKNYEKNLSLATKLHYAIEEKYPGISKGVITKEGANSNGVYNQDLSSNALLMEIGGYENTLDEMYLTADIVADVFSEHYWDAEKVNR